MVRLFGLLQDLLLVSEQDAFHCDPGLVSERFWQCFESSQDRRHVLTDRPFLLVE